MTSSCQFRVLSLDGGGIRGLFPSAFLAHIEKHAPKPLHDCFDLIVGTSTGGIIALALALGIRAKDILTFYEVDGRRIFSNPRSLPAWLLRPKYRAEPLLKALHDLFKGSVIADAKTKLCIPSYESIAGTPRVFKTENAKGLTWGLDIPMWKVAAATSAAPMYFPAFRIDKQDCHLDGGVWANNPVHVGITEAISRLGRRLDELLVLSVGTGRSPFTVSYEAASSMGLARWVFPSFDLITSSQSKAAHQEARFLIPEGQYVRVDVDLPKPIYLDDYEGSLPLIELGFQAGRLNLERVAKMFF